MAFTFARRSNPARTEVSDADGWVATFTDTCRVVTLKGQPRTFVEQSAGIYDQFTRTSTQGWGDSPAGGSWFTVGGNATNYATTGSAGSMKATATATAYRALITNAHTDIDMKVRLRQSSSAAGHGLQQGVVFSYRDSQNYYMAHMSVIPGGITDNFGRTVTSGWGTSTSGHTWAISGGTAENYKVSNSTGIHNIVTVNSSLKTLLTGTRDFDCKVKIATSTLAQGASILAGILGRYQDTNNYYNFRVRFASAPSNRPLFVCIQKQVAGTATTIGSEVAANIVHTAGSFVWVRVTASGTTLGMKIWPYNTDEPAAWHVQVTDSTFTAAGQIGLRSLVSAGNTNTLPLAVSYDSFTFKPLNTASGSLQLTLQKRLAGTTRTIGSSIMSGASYASSAAYWLRATMSGGSIKLRLWKDGAAEPSSWHLQVADSSLPSGSLGLRSYCAADTPALPVTFYFEEYRVQGVWPSPPTITHTTWVRLLTQPFTGTVDESWLAGQLANNAPDILALGTQYITWAPAVTGSDGGHIGGDAQYSRLLANGTRVEGADFNDYLGQSWQYSSGTHDPADPAALGCLDCSGFVRMVYGYRGGYPLALSASSAALPRSSTNLAYHAPGILLASSTSAPPSLSGINFKPGDIVYFSAAASGGGESQLDHVGIYMGIDTQGNHRFISSRHALNGPTLADVGGASTLNGTGRYPDTLRVIRRL